MKLSSLTWLVPIPSGMIDLVPVTFSAYSATVAQVLARHLSKPLLLANPFAKSRGASTPRHNRHGGEYNEKHNQSAAVECLMTFGKGLLLRDCEMLSTLSYRTRTHNRSMKTEVSSVFSSFQQHSVLLQAMLQVSAHKRYWFDVSRFSTLQLIRKISGIDSLLCPQAYL